MPDPLMLCSLQFCASFLRWLPLCHDAHYHPDTDNTPICISSEVSLQSARPIWPNGPHHSTWMFPNHPKPSTPQTKPIMLSLPQTSLSYWIPPSGCSPHGAFSFSNQKHGAVTNTSLSHLSVNKCVLFRQLHLFFFSAWMTAVTSRWQISPH